MSAVPAEFYQFPEYPWPQHIQRGLYPNNQAVHEYVRSYAEHFGILPHIR
jgi:cation diffusion facilitator CzcD-associated flavoprotein CzcO